MKNYGVLRTKGFFTALILTLICALMGEFLRESALSQLNWRVGYFIDIRNGISSF